MIGLDGHHPGLKGLSDFQTLPPPRIAIFSSEEKQKKMIKTSKIKILRDVVMLLYLLVRKNKKHKFRHVLQKSVMKK